MHLVFEAAGEYLYLKLLLALPDRAYYLKPFVVYLGNAYSCPYSV
jgi:hypothetical protein